MQVKYPLCKKFTIEFLTATIDAAFHNLHPDYTFDFDGSLARELNLARDLATVDGLIWG